MKTRCLVLIAALFCARSHAGDLRYPSVAIGGHTYSNVTISRIEYDEAVCIHSKGILKASLADLPPVLRSDVQKAFAPAPSPATHGGQEQPEKVPSIDTETDEFEGVVKYQFSDSVDIDWDPGALNYRIVVHVDVKTTASRPIIIFDHIWGDDPKNKKFSISLRETWPHSENRSMILLIDGDRTDLGDFSYRNNIITTKYDETIYHEMMSAEMTMATLKAMSEGKNVRIRLGKDDLTIPPNKRLAIKAMCGRLEKDYPQKEKADDRKTQE